MCVIVIQRSRIFTALLGLFFVHCSAFWGIQMGDSSGIMLLNFR